MLGPRRQIVGRTYYRTSSHPDDAADSVIITFECGHSRRYKGSREPRTYAYCGECPRLRPIVEDSKGD